MHSGIFSRLWIFESKGRIGATGTEIKRKRYTDYNDAIAVFKKIYLEKTGNNFGSEIFVKKPGKYFQINVDTDALHRQLPRNSVPTKLTESLYRLMENIFCYKSILIEQYLDLKSLPLGLVRQQSIQEGLKLLGEISLMLMNTNVQNQIISASNQFFSYIPHDFGLQRPPIINSAELIKEKRNMLQEVCKYDYLTSELNTEKNLVDICYEHLEKSVEFKVLDKSSDMHKQIFNYVKNTQLNENLRADEIFEARRYKDVQRYEPFKENFNRQLLFHCSSNFVKIFTDGLKSGPPEGCLTGATFQNGIYFTDSASKVIQCQRIPRLMLLCEVALGLSDIRHNYDNSDLSENCESVQAIGQFNPRSIHTRSDGLKIPNGALTERPEHTGITFSQFGVFDESRVKIRYIVRLQNVITFKQRWRNFLSGSELNDWIYSISMCFYYIGKKCGIYFIVLFLIILMSYIFFDVLFPEK